MKTKMLEILGVFVCFLTITACQLQKDNEKQVFDEWTRANGKNMSQGDWEYQDARAKKMEADLVRRRRFYEALEGIYEGAVQIPEGNFNVRLVLTQTWPPYPVDPNRIRTIAEVESDLMNLSFNVQVQQWNPANTLSSVGCVFIGVRPKMNKGLISVTGDCPNSYTVALSENGLQSEEVPSEMSSGAMASQIIEGALESVSSLYGEIRPTTNASVYKFSLTRVLQ